MTGLSARLHWLTTLQAGTVVQPNSMRVFDQGLYRLTLGIDCEYGPVR